MAADVVLAEGVGHGSADDEADGATWRDIATEWGGRDDTTLGRLVAEAVDEEFVRAWDLYCDGLTTRSSNEPNDLEQERRLVRTLLAPVRALTGAHRAEAAALAVTFAYL